MVFKIIKNFYGKFGIFILFFQFFIKHIHFSTLKIAWFKIHLPRIPCSRLSLIVDWWFKMAARGKILVSIFIFWTVGENILLVISI